MFLLVIIFNSTQNIINLYIKKKINSYVCSDPGKKLFLFVDGKNFSKLNEKELKINYSNGFLTELSIFKYFKLKKKILRFSK